MSKTIDFLIKILYKLDQDIFNLTKEKNIKTLFDIFNNKINKYIENKYDELFDRKKLDVKFSKDLIDRIKTFNNNIEIIKKNIYYKIVFDDSINDRTNFMYKSIYYNTPLSLKYYMYHNDELHVNIESLNTIATSSISRNIYNEYRGTIEELKLNITNNSELNSFIKTLNDNNFILPVVHIKRSINSCGIILVHGLNELFYKCNDTRYYRIRIKINKLNAVEIHIKDLNLYVQLLDYLIRKKTKDAYNKSSMVLFSTNTTNNKYIDEINVLLDVFKKEGVVHQIESKNDNSDNQIITLMLDYKTFINKYE